MRTTLVVAVALWGFLTPFLFGFIGAAGAFSSGTGALAHRIDFLGKKRGVGTVSRNGGCRAPAEGGVAKTPQVD